MPLTDGPVILQRNRLFSLLAADPLVNDLWYGDLRKYPADVLPTGADAAKPVVAIYCADGHTGFASKQSDRVRNRYVMVITSRWDADDLETMYETAINTRDALAAALLRLRRDPTPGTQYWHKLMFVGETDQNNNPGAGESTWTTDSEPSKWIKTITQFYLSLDVRA